jgi:hypothetical protein
MQESPWTDRIDDAIVLGYGLAALTLAYIWRAELVALRSVKAIIVMAFALFFVMVALDLLTNSYSISPGKAERFIALRSWGVVIEDSFKVASEGVFVAGLLTAVASLKRLGLTGKPAA